MSISRPSLVFMLGGNGRQAPAWVLVEQSSLVLRGRSEASLYVYIHEIGHAAWFMCLCLHPLNRTRCVVRVSLSFQPAMLPACRLWIPYQMKQLPEVLWRCQPHAHTGEHLEKISCAAFSLEDFISHSLSLFCLMWHYFVIKVVCS